MEHVAIDWGARESQICVRSPAGEIVDSRRLRTAKLGEYLARRPPSRVIVEASTQAFAIADQARALGHEIRVVPSTLAPALGVGARRTKNDRRDAETLSSASCRIDLPSVHIPSAESRERKAIISSRAALVRSRTLLVNAVRGWLRSDGRSVTATPEGFPARVRIVLQTVPDHIEHVLVALDTLNAQIKKADHEIRSIARSDEVCRRLMTAPGIGPITAVLYQATVDELCRFKSAHFVESYLGLVPGEHSSGDAQHRIGITKAGPPLLRALLVQAAWAARRCRKVPSMVTWADELARRRGKHVAVVALARKLAGILFAMWRDGKDFDMSR